MVTAAVEVAIAGWFTSTIIGKLINKASSYFEGQKSWQSGMKVELDRLSESQPKIETLVYAAERGDLQRAHNPALEEWLGKLRDAVEEANNVLDELEYWHLNEEADDGKGKSVKTIGKIAVRAAQQDDVLKRLTAVVKTFDKLVAGLGTLAQVLKLLDGRTTTELRGGIDRETGSVFPERRLFGREKEKQTIIHWLNNSHTETISVFSIVGVGGVGKTALAQYLYDQSEVDFKIKMWACVLTSFEVKDIIMKMLESLTQTKHEFDTLDAAKRTLKDNIRGQKFLLVLDDVWNDKEREKWNKVMAVLKFGGEGSKILLTTRMESVADTVANVVGETKMSLNLNGLEERDNVLLFEQYAFAGFDPNEYARLRLIGNKIASKVRGIPLAVKAVGGMLNNKLEAEYWNRVLEDGALNWDKETDGIMAAIRLSYEHLPPDLKPCFRYCSIFPPDHEFDKGKLVDVWISIGLIPEGKKSQEELASDIFDTLVRKSFFEPKASYYSMHDLLHELAQILSKNECLRVVSNDPIQIPQSIRHFSLMTSNILVLKNLSELKYLRTLLLFCDIEDDGLVSVINTALKGFKTIRWLELSSKWLRDFPKSIGDLVHLRCLSIMRTHITKLSQCVCSLYHLQILEFINNPSFDHSEGSIPADICKLSKLKRLYLPSGAISTIPRIGKLSSLQELIYYSVKGEAGYDVGELEMMSDLRELLITNLDKVKSTEEASKAKLHSKKHLHYIALAWGHGFENIGRNEMDKEVADCLQPGSNLTNLSFNGYRAINPPNWLNHQIVPNVTSINLAYCSSLERLPPFGQLPYLKFLTLEDMGALKEIGLEFYGSSQSSNTFPALDTLKLVRLIQLDEWREDSQREKWFPRLKRLVVVNCPSLKKLPPIPTALEELELNYLETDTLPEFKQKNEGCSTNEGPWSLSSLLIIGCSKLTSLSSGFFMHPEQLASLEELAIWNCAELVHLPSDGFRELISLKSLRIDNCRRLFLLPLLLPKNFFPPSLQRLMLSDCDDLFVCLPQLLQDLSLISLLKLEHCANLISLPSANVLQSLTSLKELEIRNCKRLKSLGGLEVIPSLKVLLIRTCPKLATKSPLDSIEQSSRNRLSMALDQLDIDHPEHLLAVPNLHLTKSVQISGSHSITLLPEQRLLQNGASLRYLSLSGLTLRSVETLPDSLQSLPRLRFLQLHKAYWLTRLPELPRSLEILEIFGCSEELNGRLMEGGLDYDKIRHLDVAVFGVLSQSRISQFS
ncbi:putative disease resistance protein RGA3 [Carex rostrata]